MMTVSLNVLFVAKLSLSVIRIDKIVVGIVANANVVTAGHGRKRGQKTTHGQSLNGIDTPRMARYMD